MGRNDEYRVIELEDVAAWLVSQRAPQLRALCAASMGNIAQPFEDTDAVETQEGEDTYAPISA